MGILETRRAVAMFLIAPAIAVLSAGCGRSPAVSDDVLAARACQVMSVYLKGENSGRPTDSTPVVDAASKLHGTKWAVLETNMKVTLADIASHNASAISSDGATGARLCASIPTAAKTSGG